MTMQDPISDMLTCIRNAQTVGAKQVQFPASNLKLSILNVLQEEGYILSFEVQEAENKKTITVFLKYYQGRPVIDRIDRVSRPGLRIYKRNKALPTVRAGMGIAVVSTSRGVMTEKSARTQNLGGEILCVVE